MAGMVQQEQVEEIRRRTDIVELIGSRVPLRRSGSDFSACCPFHKERTPSFHVNPSRQTFKCFGCGEHGDVFGFLMKHDGLTFGDALRMLAERAGVELSYGPDDGQGERRKRLLRLHAELAEFYRLALAKSPTAEAARAYVRSRELPPAIVEQFGLGFAPVEPGAVAAWARANRFTDAELVEGGVLTVVDRDGRQSLHDRFRGRLMFPIQDTQGRVVAFSGRILQKDARAAKYVNSAESPIFSKSHILYALDKAQRAIVSAPGRRAIVCEGQIDVIRCHACGFAAAVASQGTAFTPDHVQLLKRYADSAVLVFDSDTAGQKAAVATARLFLASGVAVRVARLPDGKDPDDFLRQRGADAFREALDQAEEVIPFQTRWLQEQERDPRSSDALGRIASSLLETIRGCGNAVHQARLLQEAAELLQLPESALATQLARLVEAEERRAARRGSAVGDARQRDETEQRRLAARAQAEANAILAPDLEPPETAELVVDGAGRAPTPPRIRPEEYSLCEFLVHHVEEPALVKLVDEHLPLALLQHPHARLVAGAVFDTVRSGRDELLALQETGAPDVLEFIRRIAVAPVRSALGDFTQRDVAQDLVLAIWRRWVQRRASALAGQAGDPVTLERERMRLSLDLRALESWARGHAVIVRERPALLEATSPAKAAAPSAPAAVRDAPAASYEPDGDAGRHADEQPPTDEPPDPLDEMPEW